MLGEIVTTQVCEHGENIPYTIATYTDPGNAIFYEIPAVGIQPPGRFETFDFAANEPVGPILERCQDLKDLRVYGVDNPTPNWQHTIDFDDEHCCKTQQET